MATNIPTSAIGVNNNETVYSASPSVTTEYMYARNQNYLRIKNTGTSPLMIQIETDGQRTILQGMEEVFNVIFQSFKIIGGGSFTAVAKNDIVLLDEINEVKAAIANLGGGTGGVDEAAVRAIVIETTAPLVNEVTAGLTITSPSGSLEVGAELTSVSFSWTIGNHESAKSARIADVNNSYSSVEVVAVAASGTHTETVSITKTEPGTQSYRFDVTDKLDRVVTSPIRTINWYYATYCGSSASTSLDAAGVKALATKALKSAKNGNYTCPAGNYKYIAYPKSWGTSTFKDYATGLGFDMQAPATVTITNDEGVSVEMYVYRSTNKLASETTIQVL
jgi:hypothetical protein